MRRSAVVGLVAVVAACAGPAERATSDAAPTDGLERRPAFPWIAIGDRVIVADDCHSWLDATREVGLDGTIDLPQCGPIVVVGLDGEEALARLLELSILPHTSLSLHVEIGTLPPSLSSEPGR